MMGAALIAREAISALADMARTTRVEDGAPPALSRSSSVDDAAASGRAYDLLFFDKLIDGLNRLPRPMLAYGTLALFIYAMVDPVGFAERMAGLQEIPEPLWWLLGGVVGFHFGAREAHYFRARPAASKPAMPDAPLPDPNLALDTWRARQTD